MTGLRIHDDAWGDARKLGVAKDLEKMVRLSALTDHELGHRRYEDTYFVIERSEVVGVNRPGAVNCNKEPDDDPVLAVERLEMTCPYCTPAMGGGACAVCDGTRKVSGSRADLARMLEETS